MKKRVRIKDIAEKAGVSTGTVDRVLHERGSVAPEVKKRVLEVIEELGYERNPLASALAYNKTARIIALLPEPDKDFYWWQTHQGVDRAVKAVQHYGLFVDKVFFNYGDRAGFLEQAKEAMATQPDGFLFPPMFTEEARWLMEACEEAKVPYVMINTNLEGGNPLSYIGQDSYHSGVLGARLLNYGLAPGMAAAILNLDSSEKAAQHLISKEQGFRDYFTQEDKRDIRVFRADCESFDDPNKLRDFMTELLDTHADLQGIFVTNSRAFKIMDCSEELMTKRGVKIVGFDLIPPNLEYLKQNRIDFLINQNPTEQGFRGIYCLFQHLIQGQAVRSKYYLPLDIIVKENADYHVQEQLIHDVQVVV